MELSPWLVSSSNMEKINIIKACQCDEVQGPLSLNKLDAPNSLNLYYQTAPSNIRDVLWYSMN